VLEDSEKVYISTRSLISDVLRHDLVHLTCHAKKTPENTLTVRTFLRITLYQVLLPISNFH